MVVIILLLFVGIMFFALRRKPRTKDAIWEDGGTIRGIVQKSKGKATPHYDYPTANLFGHHSLPSGIYTANTEYGKAIVISIRHAHKELDGAKDVLEVHIKKFSGDLYGKEITLRDIKKKNDPFAQIFNAGVKALGYI